MFLEVIPEPCVDAIGTSAEPIEPLNRDDAVGGSLDVLSTREVAFSSKRLNAC